MTAPSHDPAAAGEFDPPAPAQGRGRLLNIIVFLAVFLVVFAGALFYTLAQPKIYQSTAVVQLLRGDASAVAQPVSTPAASVDLVESRALTEKVAARLTGDQLRQLMAPYATGSATEPVTTLEVLNKNLALVPQRLSLLVWIHYRHPDRQTAATVANLFAEEFIASSNQRPELNKARLLDRARPAAEADYVAPNLPLHLGLGFLLAVGAGLAAALASAGFRLISRAEVAEREKSSRVE